MRIILLLLSAGAIVVAQDAQAAIPEPSLLGNLPAQKIGSNDLLSISVYGAPELTRTVRVSAEGFIRLPMLKQRVEAKGQMPTDLEEKIAGALSAEEILVNPVVTVNIAEYHSRPISVAGAVKLPVTLRLNSIVPRPSSFSTLAYATSSSRLAKREASGRPW